MRILGIDPGSLKVGYAVIEVVGRSLKYIFSGTIQFKSDENFFKRLIQLNGEMKTIVDTFKPDEIALESLIYVKNVSSMAKLSQARGAMISSLTDFGAENIFEYSPNLVKSTVSGHGHSSKMGIQKTIKLFFGNDFEFKTSDESDAVAIAICHSLLRGQNVANQHLKTKRRSSSLKDHFKHLES